MKPLSVIENELEALRILWEKGALKPAQIQEHFTWPIENATLRSVLVNLVEKRQATRKLQGKAFYYSARVTKATLLQGMFQRLAHVFAGGSERELVAQLVETADITPADILLLRQVTQGAKPAAGKAKSP